MKRFQNSDAFARASRRFTSAGIRHFLNFSLIFTMLLTLGVGQMWATLSFHDANNGVKFSKSSNNGTNYYDHEIKHGTTNPTQNVGIVTNLYLKEYFVQLYQDEDNYTGTTHVFYWFYSTASGRPGGAATSYSGNWGDWGSWNDGKRYPKFGNNNISNDGGKTNVNLLYGKDAGEYTFEYYFNAECKNGWAPVVCSNGGGNFKVTFTVPGFNSTSISKSFGATIPVETESETTIGFNHYGTALTTSNCSITGTNASMFTVRSINESGVTVSFSPGSSTGAKSATLTITDAHSKRCTITLNATVVEAGTKTRLYFNNFINKDGIKSNSNWTKDGALSRFTVQYSTGVYTHYPMTQCANSTYNYYADVEIKGSTVSVDRYNPSSPYNTWNTASISGINTTNRYAQLDNFDGNFYGFATNHPYNDVSGGYIYYDNSESKFTNTLYFIVGHDYKMTDGGGSSLYSKSYSMTPVTNTKLYYKELSDTWHDADYYAVVGASSSPGNGEWGSSLLSSKGTGGYSGIFRDILDLKTSNAYLGVSTGTGAALSMTKRASANSSTLNSTQTVKYALATNGTTAAFADEMTSGSTPATVTIASYKFSDGSKNSVSASSSPAKNIGAGTTGTYSQTETAGYTATTTITVSDVNENYRFKGFYSAATGGSQYVDLNANENDYVYYPKGATTLYVRFVSLYNISYNLNGGTGTLPTKGAGKNESGTNVVLGNNNNTDGNGNISKDGYTLSGWNTLASGTGDSYALGGTISAIASNKTLYAVWTQDITLDREGATCGSTSLAATYNATLDLTSYIAPTRTGYNFAGYWTGDNGTGDMVINAAGEVQTVASWTDGDKKWIHNAASTLYAKWTEKTHTVTLANDDHGVVKIGDSEVTEVTAGEVTASSAITAEPNTGYHFANWTIPSGVTIASGSESSATITINATADSKTVTANFAANNYTITLDSNGGEGGTASVIATYDATPPTGDGTGNYYFSITNPTKPGCTFLGWFTAADGGDLVINTDGTFNANVDGYTSNYPGNIWIHPDNATLYAHWEVVRYVIYHHGQAPVGEVEEYAGGTIPQPIEYRRKFEKDTWYSIYFPFDVTAVQVIDDEDGLYYDLKPYYRSSNGVLHSRHYIIRKATPATNMDISKFESKIGESGWLDPAGESKTDVDSWLPEKNTPYMIQFHNDYYTDKWIAFIGAAGSTFATDFELGDAPADSGFVNIYGNNTLHSTSLTTRTYMINYNEYEGRAWTRFDEGTTLYPFEVYMRAEAKTTEQHQVLGRRPKQEDTATAVDDIYTETSCLRVYTLTGQLLLTLYHITPDDAGRQLQQQLGQGIYILHSDHSSYKLIIGGH